MRGRGCSKKGMQGRTTTSTTRRLSLSQKPISSIELPSIGVVVEVVCWMIDVVVLRLVPLSGVRWSQVTRLVVVCTLGRDVITSRCGASTTRISLVSEFVGGMVVPTLHACLVLAIIPSLPSSSTLRKVPTWHGCVIDKSMAG
uniref:Uncharacterized protein n=1 Tax=Cannabis sativa TaxID=3483 RepID=A0A803PUA4_CANSA